MAEEVRTSRYELVRYTIVAIALFVSHYASLSLGFATDPSDSPASIIEAAIGDRGYATDSVTAKGTVEIGIFHHAEEALASIGKLDIKVRSTIRAVHLMDKKMTHEVVKSLTHCPKLEFLAIAGNWRDEWTESLAKSMQLKMLWIQNKGLTGKSLESLKDSDSLEVLMLDGNPFEAGSLLSLRKIINLRQLAVSGKGIGDDDLAVLRELPLLTALHLDGTAVTDKGLSHITICKKLRILSLTGTAVTKQGVATLNATLPDAIISSSPMH